MQLYIDYFTLHIFAASVIVAFFSLMIGSFLNVVIHRLPIMLQREWDAEITGEMTTDSFNLITPHSHCPHCQHPIAWYENIPLLSYFLLLRAKCSQCKTPISMRYPLVEALAAVISVPIVFTFGFNAITLYVLVFSWILIALTFIDLDHFLLPDKLTLPLLWIGLLLNTQNTFTSLESAVYGAAAGYLSLWSIYWAFKLATGKEGMGYGDFKLLAALGAWMGITALPIILLLSSVSAVVIALILALLKKQQLDKPIPFGPYLTIAGFVSLLWGEQLTQLYLELLL
ncbi:MAG: prepilin peptidase [Oceanospirillaceae bacterium]|nr:prepilin peptidase [Oceanospirillaceae bacterium]